MQRRSRSLLGPVLADRFKLQFHREMRDLPVYALTLAKGGHKLKPVNGENTSAVPDGSGGILFQDYPMDALATLLTNTSGVGRAVVDRTGLTGNFVFRQTFSIRLPNVH